MMEGANLSGDLKDPAYAIPYGTIAAVSTAFLFYILLIIGQAGSMDDAAVHQFYCVVTVVLWMSHRVHTVGIARK